MVHLRLQMYFIIMTSKSSKEEGQTQSNKYLLGNGGNVLLVGMRNQAIVCRRYQQSTRDTISLGHFFIKYSCTDYFCWPSGCFQHNTPIQLDADSVCRSVYDCFSAAPRAQYAIVTLFTPGCISFCKMSSTLNIKNCR